MSDKNPCPFCGDESEYLRFLDLCAERANEIWRENELKVFTNMCKSLDFVQVVRCKDCVRYSLDDYGNTWCAYVASAVQPDDFCAWGENEGNIQ